MDSFLIVIVDLIFLFGEVVVFQSDDKFVSWFWWCLQRSILGFMDTINKTEFVVSPLDLFPGFRVEPSYVFSI